MKWIIRRVIYLDDTAHESRFEFVQDAERGTLILSSSALPHPPTFTSELGWG